jgi:hypothetical protein
MVSVLISASISGQAAVAICCAVIAALPSWAFWIAAVATLVNAS